MSKELGRILVVERVVNVEADALLIFGVGHGAILKNLLHVVDAIDSVVEKASRPTSSRPVSLGNTVSVSRPALFSL
jgi:hypothetical protein